MSKPRGYSKKGKEKTKRQKWNSLRGVSFTQENGGRRETFDSKIIKNYGAAIPSHKDKVFHKDRATLAHKTHNIIQPLCCNILNKYFVFSC